jgi:hypothetical protein
MEKENVVKENTPANSALDKTAAVVAKLQDKKADDKRETQPSNSFDS